MPELEKSSGIDSFEALILSNPFIQSPGDEVNARTLLNWVLQHNELKNEKNQEDSIFLDVLKKLYSIGAFLHREENNRIILIATAKYLDLKKGINTKQIEIIKIPYFKSCQTTIIDSPNPDYLTSYKEDYQEKHNIGYYDILIENLRQYSGPYKEIQIHCPIFFKLLCDILNDRFTDWHTKIMISSCLAYFVLEKDVIPDHQETGYIDDLFIVSYVLKEIMETTPELIDSNWNYKENIFDLIDEVYLNTTNILGNSIYEILRKVGLHKFQTLELEDYSGNYPQKLAKIASEKRELLGIVAFLLNKINNTNLKIQTLDKIHRMLRECSDYDEVIRLIELSKINHEFQVTEKNQPIESFKDVLEKRLKEARMKSLQNH